LFGSFHGILWRASSPSQVSVGASHVAVSVGMYRIGSDDASQLAIVSAATKIVCCSHNYTQTNHHICCRPHFMATTGASTVKVKVRTAVVHTSESAAAGLDWSLPQSLRNFRHDMLCMNWSPDPQTSTRSLPLFFFLSFVWPLLG